MRGDCKEQEFLMDKILIIVSEMEIGPLSPSIQNDIGNIEIDFMYCIIVIVISPHLGLQSTVPFRVQVERLAPIHQSRPYSLLT